MIFDRMTQYAPRQDFGARHQQVFDREAMAGMGGGMGRAHNPNGGINPNGMYTGGNAPPQVGLPPMGGPGQQFQGANMLTGGQLPPMQAQGWTFGGPQQQYGQSPLMALWGRRMSGY